MIEKVITIFSITTQPVKSARYNERKGKYDHKK